MRKRAFKHLLTTLTVFVGVIPVRHDVAQLANLDLGLIPVWIVHVIMAVLCVILGEDKSDRRLVRRAMQRE